MKQAASETSDSRMQLLAAATTGLSAKNAYDAVQQSPDTAGGVNLSLSIGTSKSSSTSTSTQTSSRALGSTVQAGNNRVPVLALMTSMDSKVQPTRS